MADVYWGRLKKFDWVDAVLRRKAAEAGLTIKGRNGCWHIRGGAREIIVTIVPVSGLVIRASGLARPIPATVDEAIAAAFQLPKVPVLNRVHRKAKGRAKRSYIYIRSNRRCRWCGVPVTLDDSTIEHIIPISRGGSEDMSNLGIACPDCNVERFDSDDPNWVPDFVRRAF